MNLIKYMSTIIRRWLKSRTFLIMRNISARLRKLILQPFLIVNTHGFYVGPMWVL